MSEETVVRCDECGKEVDELCANYIRFPMGDMDQAGIWFGDVGRWLWFNEERFCCLDCFLKFVTRWHMREWSEK